MLIASFLLNEADIQTLKLNDKIRIDNSWWNINKVIDYNANDEVLTKVELISIDTEIELANFPINPSRPIGDILTASGISEINDQIKKQSNVNLSEGNFQIFGKGNVVPSGLKGIVIGDNQSVTEDGITTTNLTITETINGQPLNDILSTYQKYVALISQSGTADPTITILENTIGNIVWTRSSTGDYLGTLIGAFPQLKTFIVFQNFYSGTGSHISFIQRITDDTINIVTKNNTNAFIDNVLDYTTIEIRVYP
jgi:hypothetical protein